MFPSPTAEPTAARMKPVCVAQTSLGPDGVLIIAAYRFRSERGGRAGQAMNVLTQTVGGFNIFLESRVREAGRPPKG